MNKNRLLFLVLVMTTLILFFEEWGLSRSFLREVDMEIEVETESPSLSVNIEDEELPSIVHVLNTRSEYSKFAFVVLFYKVDHKIAELRNMISTLQTCFIESPNYPMILFVDDETKYDWLQKEFTNWKFIYVNIDSKDWAVNQPIGSYPELFDGSVPIGYRQMGRYASGFMFQHPVVQQFDFVLKLDDHIPSIAPYLANPFTRMKGKQFAYWVALEDIPRVTEHLEDRLKLYLVAYNITLKQHSLIFDTNGKYRRSSFYGCFIGANPAFFRTKEYKQLFDFLDITGGWFKWRWDEQKIITFYVAMYLEKDQIEFMDYIRVNHVFKAGIHVENMFQLK